MKLSGDQTRELLDLLMHVDGHSKAAAKNVFNGITPEGRLALLHELRRKKLEREGQGRLSLEGKVRAAQQAAEKAPQSAGKAKKVPYTLLLPPEQLDALRSLAERDDSSVSHHIRQAIRGYLRSKLV